MAGELQFRGPGADTTCYVLIRTVTGTIWNGSSFETYVTANYTTYDIAATEQGTSSNYFTATFPSTIPTGRYYIEAKQQLGGTPAETDPSVADGTYDWNGATVGLADLATSGQLGLLSPMRLARGSMLLNFPVYLKSSADHVTPFTSGVVSGQISRDGGSFGALQSGAFTEIGLGFYRLQALTSGDTLANTISLVFTAVGISGGAADPLPISIVTQRTSGQAG